MWKYADIDKQSEEVRSQTESEFLKTKVLFEAKLMAGEGQSEDLKDSPFSLNPQEFSSVARLWRITALALRFVDKVRKKTRHCGPPDTNELTKAEEMWTNYVQRQHYPDVVECLKVKYKGILFYEILMDCVARKRIQKTTSNYLKWFPRYCDLNFTYYLINIHEFIYDIIVEHWNL